MPELAPVVAMAFLAAAGGLLLSLAALLAAAVARRRTLALWIAAVDAAGLAAYAGVLFFFSWRSQERVLLPGDKKYFCEIDCHIAYSVQSVRRPKSVGPPDRPLAASGEFAIVTIVTWFDQRSIGPHRGNAPLTPNPRTVYVVDAQGRRTFPSPLAQEALDRAGIRSTPMTEPLRPGDSYETVLAFDLPVGVRDPRLLVTDAESPQRFLIGHENSLFHRKIFFNLEETLGPPGAAQPIARPAADGLSNHQLGPVHRIATKGLCPTIKRVENGPREGPDAAAGNDASALDRVHRRDPGRQRHLLSGSFFRSSPLPSAPTLSLRYRPGSGFSLLRDGLRRHPPRRVARAKVESEEPDENRVM